MDDVGVDWIKDHPDINNVARRCQPAFPLSELLDQSWNRKHVHFFITAEEAVEDAGPAKDAEERDRVSEFPLQMMHRRESQVSTPPLQALNLVRFPRGASKIPGTFYRCHIKRVRQVAEEFEDSHIRWVLRIQRGPKSNGYHHCAPRPDLPPSLSGVLR